MKTRIDSAAKAGCAHGIDQGREARRRHSARARADGGFTLVELLVAVAIGMAITLAITGLMARQEGDKRSLGATNDLSLTSAFLSFELDRELRSAGSGFAQGWSSTFGCVLRAARGGAQILPRASAFPVPFDNVPQTVRLAPVLIHGGVGENGSDVLAMAVGSSGLGETAIDVQPASSTTTAVRLPNTVGVRANDLFLVAQDGVGCMVQQVTSPFAGGAAQQLDFGGTYAKAEIDGLQLDTFSEAGTARVFALGNVAGNVPLFELVGIGPGQRLFRYDLLRLDGSDAARPIAEGVVDLRARYGADTDANGVIDQWFSPADAGYSAAELTAGTLAAQERMRNIMALRISIVLRASLPERNDVAPASLTLFETLDAGQQVTVNLGSDEQKLRHRVLEFTVPLRNAMLVNRL